MSSKKTPRSLGKKGKGKVLVPKWKVFRAKEPLLSVFMWGVNHSIDQLMHVAPPGLLMPDDFKAYAKVKIDNHCFNKDIMPSHYKVKEYCPNVFRALREQFSVDSQEYLRSLTSYEPDPDSLDGSKTGSSPRLFISYDKKFVIKSMDSDAVEELHSVLRDYHEYVVECQGRTLLPQYLGLYRLTIDGNETYLIVMRNVFGRKYNVHTKFDLKGSTVSRAASDKEKSKELPTYKDNDFLDQNIKLCLPEEAKHQLLQMLARDTQFLSKMHLMDYSLLLGIHDCDRAAAEAANRPPEQHSEESGDELAPTPPDSPVPSIGAFPSMSGGPDLEDEFYAISSRSESDKRLIYFIGLVDILTYYGVKKRTAAAAKTMKYGSDVENISTVKPDQSNENAQMEEEEKVKVVVRCRPISDQEIGQGHTSLVTTSSEENSIGITNPATKREPQRTFFFDAVFAPDSDQMRIYNVAARPIVENVLKGYNGTIFAYGQTGTGKTFTMTGDLEKPELRGIIPNSFAHIFDHISKSKENTTFLVRVSYLEIYNEEIRDLLDKDGGTVNLEIKERADVGVYVKSLSSITVSNADHMQKIMEFGNKNRKVGATMMNVESSRSHAMFTVTIECATNGHVTQGKLQLVDLAGSERQSKTGAAGERLKEAAKINLSLSTLGNVISALVDNKSTHVPYRNSKLTRLLQDSLGGNSKTVMIANVGPASYNYDETLSTLRYANRAKNIKNVARINEDPKDAQLRKLQLEVEMLKKQLAEEEHEMNGDNEEDWELKMKEMERDLERQKEALANRDVANDDPETRRLVQEMMQREAELKRVRSEHESLRSKLSQMESKLIVGGENMLEKAEMQARLLDESNQELENSRHQESQLRDRLKEHVAAREDIEERYSSLQEEAAVKTKKLRRVWNELNEAKAELGDLETEHQREVEGLLDSIRELKKELLLNMMIIDEYIPPEYVELIEKYVSWNEEIGDWQLKAVAYTGNNMREAVLPPTDPIQLDSNQAIPLYYSYRTDVGANTTEPRPPTRTGKRERNVAKLQALLK